jgi:hypothetical protein
MGGSAEFAFELITKRKNENRINRLIDMTFFIVDSSTLFYYKKRKVNLPIY